MESTYSNDRLYKIYEILCIFRALLRDNGCNVSSVTVRTLPHPRQTDRSSSGVFTLKVSVTLGEIS